MRRYALKKDCVCQQCKTTFIVLVICFFLFIIAGCGSGGGSGIPEAAVILTWEAPTTNADGTPLTDLAGYKIYYGPGSENYTYSVNNGNTTGTSISNITAGTWCFAVKAYDTFGNESDFSDEVCTYI